MKPFFSFLFLLLSISVCAQQQQSSPNTYTQTEVDLKLQIQQKEVERLQKDFVTLQHTISQQKEQIQESINRQEQYVRLQDKKIDWLLGFMGIWATLISIGVAVMIYRLTRKTEKSEKKVEKELEETVRLKKEIEKEKNAIEEIKQKTEDYLKEIEKNKATSDEIKQKAEDSLKEIEGNKEASYEALQDIRKKQPSELSTDEKQKVETQVEKIKETKTEAQYTAEDWFWKAYDAQTKNELNDLEEARLYYKKATELNPNYADAYNNWGIALSSLGRIKGDEELFKQSIEKYKKATELNPAYADAYNNWGTALLFLGTMKKDIALRAEEIKTLLLKAETIKEGRGSYNLACLHSLLGDKNESLAWLEKSLLHNRKNREDIEKDDDFANIKDTSEFKALLDKYFQKEKQ